MQKTITIVLFLFSIFSFSQNANYIKWMRMAETDVSLQPRYGDAERKGKQKEADKKFRKDILEHYRGDTIAASNKMSELGFTYLYDRGDFVTAMRRFNQAYMLNAKNADAYYGFGTIYFNLGAMERAREEYNFGLKINPQHTMMLTDYGTTYLGEYYKSIEQNQGDSEKYLEKAYEHLSNSYKINNKDSNTVYKLSVIKMYLGECKEAKSLLKRAKKMKNPNVTEAFEKELMQKCG